MAFTDYRQLADYSDPDVSILNPTGKKKPAVPAIAKPPAFATTADEAAPDIYGGKYFTEPFVNNDVDATGRPTGGRTSNIIGAIGTGLKNMFGGGEAMAASAAPSQAAREPVAASAVPNIDQVMSESAARADKMRKPLPAVNAAETTASGVPPINGISSVEGFPGATAGIDAGGNIVRSAGWDKMRATGGGGTVNYGGKANIDERAASDFNPDGSEKKQYIWRNGSPIEATKENSIGGIDINTMSPEKVLAHAGLLAAQNTGDYQKGVLAIDDPYKKGLIQADLLKSQGTGELNAAHANAFNAEAAYHKAMADPAYLMMKERIALIKDAGEKAKAETALFNHKLTSMGADLSSDNVNLLKKHEADTQAWAGKAAKAFPETVNGNMYATAFQKYVYADPKTQAELAKNDDETKQMLMFVQKRTPAILKRPVMPTTFRPAKALANIPALALEG